MRRRRRLPEQYIVAKHWPALRQHTPWKWLRKGPQTAREPPEVPRLVLLLLLLVAAALRVLLRVSSVQLVPRAPRKFSAAGRRGPLLAAHAVLILILVHQIPHSIDVLGDGRVGVQQYRCPYRLKPHQHSLLNAEYAQRGALDK